MKKKIFLNHNLVNPIIRDKKNKNMKKEKNPFIFKVVLVFGKQIIVEKVT